MTELDNSYTPIYVQITRTLIEQLEAGEFEVGSQFLSRSEFMRRFGVGETTARRVMSDLARRGYIYSLRGRGVFVAERRQKPANIALIMPNLCWDISMRIGSGIEIGARLTQAVESEARKHGANFMLFLDTDDIEVERANILSIPDRGIDALILFYIGGHTNLDCIERVMDAGIPTVLIDRIAEGLGTDFVTTDHYGGAYRAVNCLIEHGFNRVYHLTVDTDWSSNKERAAGYTDAMRARGLPPMVIPVSHSWQTVAEYEYHARKATLQLIEENKGKPFAVFALNPALTVGALNAFIDKKLPMRDVAIAGFDEPYADIPEGLLLVTVRQPLDEIGRRSVRAALNRLDCSTERVRDRLAPKIVVTRGPLPRSTEACSAKGSDKAEYTSEE